MRPNPGPCDAAFYGLVEARFTRQIEADPVSATYLGIHAFDDRLPDATRDQVLDDLAAERRHIWRRSRRSIPRALRRGVQFERDLEIHNVRRSIFDSDVVRRWERHSDGNRRGG